MFLSSFKSNLSSLVNAVTPRRKATKARSDLTMEEMFGFPRRPKRPLTPYFRFLKEMRPKVKREYPKASAVDVTRILSARWKDAQPEVKQRLSKEYQSERKDYLKRAADYEKMLTNEDREEIYECKRLLSVYAKERRQSRKRIRSLGKPRKPMSAYFRFVAKESSNKPRKMKQSEWSRRCSAKWAKIAFETKHVFLTETRRAMVKYQRDLSRWEAKMIRLGNDDVVRRQSLPSRTKLAKKHATKKQLYKRRRA